MPTTNTPTDRSCVLRLTADDANALLRLLHSAARADPAYTGLYSRVVAATRREPPADRREPPPARHTVCRYCGLEIEGVRPYIRGEWRDRGNNAHCPSSRRLHAPVVLAGEAR